MSKNVSELRNTVLPREIFDVIEGYMMGDYTTLHVIAIHKNRNVVRLSAGCIPEFISANDTKFGNAK